MGIATLSNGIAVVKTNKLALGSSKITVVYSGSADFETSTTATLREVVKKKPPAKNRGRGNTVTTGTGRISRAIGCCSLTGTWPVCVRSRKSKSPPVREAVKRTATNLGRGCAPLCLS
jgi:hypothetical protein